MQKVQDYEDLVRDPLTGAILNSNSTSLKLAKQIKKRMLDKDKTIDDLNDRLSTLEGMMQQLLKDKDNG